MISQYDHDNTATSPVSPRIPDDISSYWQQVVDTLAEIAGVSAVVVGRIVDAGLEVAVTSSSAGNPFRKGAVEPLCPVQTYHGAVVSRLAPLQVPNALDLPDWEECTEANRGFVSYYGLPLMWPDNTIFGVLAILDNAPRTYSGALSSLMEHYRDIVQSRLKDLAETWRNPFHLIHENDDALRLSEERFRLLVEHAADDYFLHDVQGNFLDVNRQACQSTGYSRRELLTMRVHDLNAGGEGGLTHEQKAAIWDAMRSGETTTVNSRHRRKDGSSYPVEVRITCFVVREKKLFLGMVRDITERVESEQAIRRLNAELEQLVQERTSQWRTSAGLLQAVMDGATDAIFIKDTEGRFLFFNRAAAEFVGRPVQDVVGKYTQDIIGEERTREIRACELEVMREGKASTVEEVLEMNGERRVFLATRNPYRDANGEIIGVIGISRDVTDIYDLKRRETDLKKRTSIQTDMLNISLDCIKLIALDGSVVQMNKAGCHALGVPEDSSFGMPWLPLLPPDTWSDGEAALERARNGEFARFPGRSVRPGQKPQHWDNRLTPVIGEDGKPTSILCVSREVTAEQEALEALKASRERLAIAARVSGLAIWDYDISRNELQCDDYWYVTTTGTASWGWIRS